MMPLLPCPFCGGENIELAGPIEEGDPWCASCEDCGACIYGGDSEADSRRWWNGRANTRAGDWEHTAREMKKAVDAEAARADRAEAALREIKRHSDDASAAYAIARAYFEPQAAERTAPRSDAL